MKEFGADGYMVCFATFEIIGQFGDRYLRLPLEKYPKSDIAEVLRLKEDVLEEIWQSMAKKSLLSPNFLKKNILYSTKLKERADEYTRKLRSKSRQSRDNVVVDKNTLHNIRIHYITLTGWKEEDLISDDYARIHHAIKNLLLKTKGSVEQALKAITWTSEQKYCDWTMETVVKKYSDFLNPEQKDDFGVARKHYKKD